jgi:hypothetical protein
LQVNISCHILNINGTSELDTILKTIKSQPSPRADCLDAWNNCLQSHHKTINDKHLTKFWVDVYQRYDCCDKQEQRQAGKKCNFQASLQKNIWDWNHPELNSLKTYLKTFD